MELIEQIISRIRTSASPIAGRKRPFVTLSFAQSLDGSISLAPDKRVCLSNRRSETLTHQLRANHQAILVGIGTVLADDPQLNVRLVEGPDPQPVVVDSRLRFPLSARLISDRGKKPWIAVTKPSNPDKQQGLKTAGVRLQTFPSLPNGWVNLSALLEYLYREGIKSLMVEGGARIITSFLRGRLADQLVLTIAPVVMGGLRGVGNLSASGFSGYLSLRNVQYYPLNGDVIVRGDLL